MNYNTKCDPVPAILLSDCEQGFMQDYGRVFFATEDCVKQLSVLIPDTEQDSVCIESDGCPTEGAVLKRFWRENQPDMALCEFYEAVDYRSLVKELVGHVAQLQDAAKRNVKPWEDTFPPTLLPAYIARTTAEQPAPMAVVIPERELGFHENHGRAKP